MSKKCEDIQELFVCRCQYIQHQLVISTINADEYPEVYVSVMLCPARFFKRLVYGIGYIFGRRGVFGYYDEVILNPEDAPRLRKVVELLEEFARRK